MEKITAEQLEKIQHDFHEEIKDKDGYKNVVLDGVADLEGYVNSSLRIMWVLKEANSKTGGWSIPDGFNKKGTMKENINSSPTYSKVANISHHILNLNKSNELLVSAETEEEILQTLKKIAIINAGKWPGGASTTPTRLKNIDKYWRDITRKQIISYCPNIVIFGYTEHLYTECFGLTSLRSDGYEKKGDILYIAAYHPSQQKESYKKYSDQIINKVKNHY